MYIINKDHIYQIYVCMHEGLDGAFQISLIIKNLAILSVIVKTIFTNNQYILEFQIGLIVKF